MLVLTDGRLSTRSSPWLRDRRACGSPTGPTRSSAERLRIVQIFSMDRHLCLIERLCKAAFRRQRLSDAAIRRPTSS
jgi:hypothetical protein